jgi:predicted PurR-regulated permease PerM
MNQEVYRKLIFTLIFFILITISFLIIKPFITAVLTGVILSYIFYPVYSRINKVITNKNFSSLLTSILVVLIITLPLFFVINATSRQAHEMYIFSEQKIAVFKSLTSCEPIDKPLCKISRYVGNKLKDPQINYYIDTITKDIPNTIKEHMLGMLLSLPTILVNLFVVLFVMFFIFRDGRILLEKIERLTPLKAKHRKKVFKKVSDMTYAVVYGSIIIAVIQGLLGGLGFWVVGLPSPLLWAAVMIFAALIPYVGSSIIWFPAALLLIFDGYQSLDTSLIIKGILLILYGMFIVGSIDNILKPKLIGDKGGLHPVLVLLGVVGGMKFLGFIGIVVGPIILALLVAFIKIYEEEKG